MQKYQIPTAEYRVFRRLAPALEYIEQQGYQLLLRQMVWQLEKE